MTDDILDIAKWEQKYPFLVKVLDKYKEFNKPIQEEDTSKNNYDNVCYQIISRLRGNIQKNKPYCMKFIRNLGHYSYNTDYFNPTYERCDILYNWLYHSSKGEEIPDDIIKQCFDDYNHQIKIMTSTYKCSYDLYKNMYLGPMKINILKIFDNNIQIIKQILIGPDNLNKTHCRKFVCECVKIYKEIENDHCIEVRGTDNKHVQTCEMLKSFKQSYMQYIYNSLLKKDNVPSLESVEDEYMRKCQINQHVSTLTSSEDDTRPKSTRLTTSVNEYSGTSRMPEAINDADQANSLSPTVSTSLGTVAGASSLLVLLYKFTPGRRWIQSGFGRQSGRISNDLYAEGPNELLFQGFESEDRSSYNARYNIGYGSA